MSASAAACRNHPDREAIGICVECRTRVCSECVTKVDGINYCVTCLRRLAAHEQQTTDRAERPTSEVLAAFAAFGFFVVLTLLAWGMLEVALPELG